MNTEVSPGILEGKIVAPPSKSITHRLLIMGALSGRECTIRDPLFCDDTEITLGGLRKLGFDIETGKSSMLFKGDWRNVNKPVRIFVGNSGTSARFLTALAALLPIECVMDGSPRMRRRPMAPLIQALQEMGAEIEHQSGHLPLRIMGGDLSGARIKVDSTYSSQFLSAILLIAPYLEQVSQISYGSFITSKPYVDMTIALMKEAGVIIEESQNHFEIAGAQKYRFGQMNVEGDFSNAAPFMVGAAISGGKIVLKNLCVNSVQGDKIILDILIGSGSKINAKSQEVSITGDGIDSFERDMQDYPDLIPPVSVMALFAKGRSVLRNVVNLRLKESDRLKAIIENITKLGGKAYLDGDDLIIQPHSLNGDLLLTYNDHRIAMSFAMAGLRVPGIFIENSECVKKSYPDFWVDFKKLAK